MAQYLDDDGNPITASPDVKLPPGYSLLSSKGSKKTDTSKKNVKELKVQAEGMKPAPIDYTSNPKNEGLYEMYGRTGAGDATGSISVPYSKVKSYLASGGTFAGDTGSGERYDKDKAAEGKPVSWYQNIIQSPALASTPNEKQQAGSFSNLDKAATRMVLATPAYAKQLWDAAQSMHRGEVSGGDEFANLVNPAQLPKQLYGQWQIDYKVDPKMAADNLLGSLAGLGVVGAVTHGATKALGSIPERLEALHDKTTPVPAEAVPQPAEEVHPPIQPIPGVSEVSGNNGAGDSQPPNVAKSGTEGNSENTPQPEGTGVSKEISGADTPGLAPYKYEPIDTSKEVTGQFYHGTKAPISSASEFDPGSHGNEQALYGIGTYLTDNPEVAKGYAKTKGKGPEGKVLPATIDNAKLLNLEHPVPAAAHQVFENMLQGITGEKESLPATMSGKQLFGRLQEAMEDEGWPRSEAQETLSELTSELRQQGYHGLWHEGGGKVGTGPHNVAIIFPDYGVGRPLTEIVRDTVPQESAKVNSEPIRAYHGTEKEFDGAPRTDGLGAHFSPNREMAESFTNKAGDKARVIEANIGIHNPLRVEDHGGSHAAADEVIKDFVKQGVLPESFLENVEDGALHTRSEEIVGDIGDLQGPELAAKRAAAYEQANTEALEKVKAYLKSKGYDGLVYDNKAEGHGDSYVAFDPHQIALADASSNRELGQPSKTIVREERPEGPEIKAKTSDLRTKVSSLEEDLKRLESEQDVWQKIAYDWKNSSKEERDTAWEEKKKSRDEWWDKHMALGEAKRELGRMGSPLIGELREDASGRKTLWLSKDPMWVVQYATSPGIGNVFNSLQGVSFRTEDIPTLIKRIDRHFGEKSTHGAIVPAVKKLLTDAASQAGKEGVTIVGAKGRGFSATAKTAREEMNHAWQREMSADGAIGSHLKPDVYEKLSSSIPTGASEYLEKNGYSDDPVTGVVETAAKLMSGGATELSVSPAEEAYFLHDYFQSVIDEHGTDAFNTLKRVMGVAKQLKEEVSNGTENRFNLSKRTTDEGIMGSQSEGGSQGYRGGNSDTSYIERKATYQKLLSEWNIADKNLSAHVKDNPTSLTVHDPVAQDLSHKLAIAKEALDKHKEEAPDTLEALSNHERREDSATRKRVEDMTPEEMKKALLTSDVTGAPNRRAFDDAEHVSPSPAIGMSDADGLKALNDRFGYAAGNELLKAKADALKAAGLDAYHEKGDEFLYRGESPESLKEKLDKAREILRDRTIEVTLKDGKKLHFKGADFSYGTGKDLDESESGLKQHKQEREDRGERARGELRGITEVRPEDGSERNSPAELEDENTNAEQEDPSTDLDVNSVSEGDADIAPEQPKGEDFSPPAVSSSVPVQGGTQLSSAPIQIPVVPVVRMQALPMAQVRAMAAARNPQRQPKSVREVMEEAKKRSPNSIVP